MRLSLSNLLQLGVGPTTPDYLKRKLILSNALLWSMFGLLAAIEWMIWGNDLTSNNLTLWAVAIVSLGLLSNAMGYHVLGRWNIAVAPAIMATVNMAMVVPPSMPVTPGTLLILSFALFPALVFDPREWRHMLAATLLTTGSLLGFEPLRPLLVDPNLPEVTADQLAAMKWIFPTLAMIIALIPVAQLVRLNLKSEQQVAHLLQETRDQNEELTQTLQVISTQAANIQESIIYARRLQQAFLPGADQLRNLGFDTHVLYEPKDVIGGDFYWTGKRQGFTFVVVADCTGHGVPGALMTTLGCSLLNQEILEKGNVDPASILDQLDQSIRTQLTLGDQQMLDGMDMALLRISDSTGDLVFAGAQRPLWYVDALGQLVEIKGTRRGLGGKQYVQDPFLNYTLAAGTWHTAYACSDGWTDQPGGPEGRKLTASRFKTLIETEVCKLPFAAQGEHLSRFMHTWQGNKPQLDDRVLVVVQAPHPQQNTTLGGAASAAARVG